MLRLLLLLLLAPGLAAAETRLQSLRAEGGDFRADLSDGRVLRGADLVGAVLQLGGSELRIDEARRDAQVPTERAGVAARDVWLFRLSSRAADGTWMDACMADPNGEHLAMVYPAPDGALGMTCTAGAVGKCIRFGYRPWATTEGGLPLAPYHAACVNLVRAAYGGTERGWTRNGMLIDLYDRLGIQQPSSSPELAFEAGWTPEGAVCLAHVRVPENGALAEVASAAPHLTGRVGEACTEESAASLGALLFNRSRP